MSDAVIISIIGGAFSLIGIIVGAVLNYRLGKVKRDINGRLTQLLELTKKSSQAEGNLEGRADLKHEQDIINNKK